MYCPIDALGLVDVVMSIKFCYDADSLNHLFPETCTQHSDTIKDSTENVRNGSKSEYPSGMPLCSPYILV